MKSALFVNFTNEEFVGYWDGKSKKFVPGQSMYMPDYLAQHFAKHLTNRELIKAGMERSTSPKRPEDVPEFMKLFNQAYIPDEEAEEEMSSPKDDIDALIDSTNKNRQKKADLTKDNPQVVLPPDEDDEEEFGGKPQE